MLKILLFNFSQCLQQRLTTHQKAYEECHLSNLDQISTGW
jgi:hypothetical protein